MSWPLVPLSQVLDFIRGITFKPEDKVEPFSKGSAICMRTKNIQFELDESDVLAVPVEFVKRDEQFVQEGDLLISSANSWELVGKAVRVPKLDYICSAGGFISILRPIREQVDPNYLFRFIMHNETQHKIRHIGRQTTNISNLDRKRFLKLEIPLPPLPVQKQIAAVLEKADTLRGQCQQMEQELNTLAQSVFLDMFGDPVSNPKGWAKRKIKDLVADFKGGKSIAASESEENSGLNRVLKISAVTKGEFNANESKPLPNSYEPPEDHFVKVGDLLFSRANTTELVGATSLVFKTPDNVLLPDKLWRFVWHDKNAQSQVFMWQLLSNKSVRIELGKISSGSGGSMKNISKGKLYDLEIIYPEIESQLEFEVKFLKIRNQLSFIYELQKEAIKNFNSLMQRAFKGELALNKTKDVV